MYRHKKKQAGCPAWILEGVRQKRAEATLKSKPIPESAQTVENALQGLTEGQ